MNGAVVCEFSVPGAPVPKGRPRFRVFFENATALVMQIAKAVARGDVRGACSMLRKNATVATFTPEETRNAETAFLLQCKRHRPKQPLYGPLRVDLVFVLTPPASFPKGRSRTWPHVKPDVDNLSKLVLDSLNSVFWNDDAQVCAAAAIKVYGTTPRTDVRISMLDDDAFDGAQYNLWKGV